MVRSSRATVWGMKKWPWWVWLAIGLFCGVVPATLVIRGSDAFGSPALQEAVAWQGWVGSLIGALIGAAFAGLVAWVVLSRTLAADSSRALIQEQSARELALGQKRIDAWADFMALIREFFWFPVGEDELVTLEMATTASFFRWSLYMAADEQDTVDGVDAVLSAIIGSAREDARQARGTRASRLRSGRDDLIAELGVHGNSLHRDGVDRREAIAWFSDRVRESPRHTWERSTRFKPPRSR